MAAPAVSSSSAVPSPLKASPLQSTRQSSNLASTSNSTHSHSSHAVSLTIDASPPRYTGPRDKLDRSLFKRTLPLLAARIPAARTGAVLRAPALRGAVADIPRRRSVVYGPRAGNAPEDEESGGGDRLILLRGQNAKDLPAVAREFLDAEGAALEIYEMELDYDYWNAPEILHAIFPPAEGFDEVPSSFAITGHIAHLNIINEYLPYKHLIGEVILDKNRSIRTVVNKLDSINAQFRFFDMELLAGEPDFEVEHHEAGCNFRFDFRKVYWNSRLHTEHERLVAAFSPSDLVADVFAGVGPFAVPAAKKGCAVLANDLNPEGYRYLKKNIEGNNVSALVLPYCEDGREFIRAAVRRARESPLPPYAPPVSRSRQKSERRKRDGKDKVTEPGQGSVPATEAASPGAVSTEATTGSTPMSAATTPAPSPAPNSVPGPTPAARSRIDHFVMNLPDSALEFLDAFKGIYATEADDPDMFMPMIHVHCFTREPEDRAREDILERAAARLGARPPEDATLHLVRSVAPNKDMYCLSFRLPKEVGMGTV